MTRPKFFTWALVGGAVTFASVEMPFAFLLCLAAAIVAVSARKQDSVDRAAGFVAGSAIPFLSFAWENRNGPGRACTFVRRGLQCEQRISPWPLVAVAAVLFLVAAAATALAAVRSNGSM